jgi:hypothetical protein
MPHNNKRAKAKHPDQKKAYEAARQYFPTGSINVLMDKLREVHADRTPTQRTVEAVLYGERPDNHGIMALFKAMTDAQRKKIERAVAEMQDAD